MSVAVITDTNSGMQPEDAGRIGIRLVPMPVMINGTEYREGVNLSDKEFYRILASGAEVHTTQPLPGDVMDIWESALKDHDEVVYIPMSSGLSGSCHQAITYAKEYNGRVHVVDNQRISVTQRQSVLDAKAMAEKGMSGRQIREKLEETRYQSHIYIMVNTLSYLKKGGRITPAAAMIGEVLRIKPILQIQGEKLDAYAKSRSVRAAKRVMLEAVEKGVNEEFGGISGHDQPGAWIGLAYTYDRDAALQFYEEARERFRGFPIYMDRLPISIACHIGPGALALTCTGVLQDNVPVTSF